MFLCLDRFDATTLCSIRRVRYHAAAGRVELSIQRTSSSEIPERTDDVLDVGIRHAGMAGKNRLWRFVLT
jgi:hypothetical protein